MIHWESYQFWSVKNCPRCILSLFLNVEDAVFLNPSKMLGIYTNCTSSNNLDTRPDFLSDGLFSFPSGKTTIPAFLKLKMRKRGWPGWRANKQCPPLSENSTYLHFQQEIPITIWPKPSSISVLTKTVHICAIFEWKQGILVVIQTHIPPRRESA